MSRGRGKERRRERKTNPNLSLLAPFSGGEERGGEGVTQTKISWLVSGGGMLQTKGKILKKHYIVSNKI